MLRADAGAGRHHYMPSWVLRQHRSIGRGTPFVCGSLSRPVVLPALHPRLMRLRDADLQHSPSYHSADAQKRRLSPGLCNLFAETD